MKQIIALLVAVMLGISLAIAIGSAGAVSPSEQSCTTSGGTFTRVKGTVTCSTTETSTKDHGKFSSTTETTGQGNIGNKTKTSTDCNGAGNSNNCPPGQFK